jgi:hypothetical protein
MKLGRARWAGMERWDIRWQFRPGKQKGALVRREWEDIVKVNLKIRLWWWELDL